MTARRSGGTCSRPACACSASSKKPRVPEPDSRLTSAVAASSAGGTPLRRRTHGWDGATTTVSVSRPTGPSSQPVRHAGSLHEADVGDTGEHGLGRRPAQAAQPRDAEQQVKAGQIRYPRRQGHS